MTTTTLDDRARALLDAPNFASIATLEPSGQPQQSVVWVKRDGDDVLFSTLRGRRKTDNLARDGRVGLLLWPADNPQTYLEVRGTAVIEDDPEGALIQELSHKYTGHGFTEPVLGSERVVVRITPHKVIVR